jgi:hypothetical protein
MFAPEPLIESLLAPHAPTADADFRGYRNDCQRMFRFCLTLAGERASAERDIYAVAAAFHDLGIFTAGTLDYLAPSCALARHWLAAQGKSALDRVVEDMIESHHGRSRQPDRDLPPRRSRRPFARRYPLRHPIRHRRRSPPKLPQRQLSSLPRPRLRPTRAYPPVRTHAYA